MSQYQKLEAFFMNVNGPLLKKQRAALLGLIDDLPLDPMRSPDELEALEGLQNLLDALADICHDDFGIDCLLTEEDNDV